MKDKIKNICLVGFLGLLMLYVLISGIWDLVNVKGRVKINVSEADELIAIEHSINGIIPMGTDYYYFCIEQSTSNAYVIQASKNWLSNAEKNGFPVTVKGLAKRYDKFEVQKEIESGLITIDGVNYPIGVDKYISLAYVREALMKIIGILALAVVIVLFKYFGTPGREAKPWQKKLIIAVMCVALVTILIAIT